MEISFARPARSRLQAPGFIVLAFAFLALALKIYCAGTTFGTNDVALHFAYGKTISEKGLIATYQSNPIFNHTPLTGEFFRTCYSLSKPDYELFPFLLRLPGIIADFLVVLALIRLREQTGSPSWWALGLLAASPVSFMVSGYHGNVDPVMVLFLVLAGCGCVKSRPVLCGFFLGMACNIKIIAILLSPVFFFYWLHRKQASGFALAVFITTLLNFIVPLLTAPEVFLKNVFGYSSYFGIWGITYWLRETNWNEVQNISCIFLTQTQFVIMYVLKGLIIATIPLLAWCRRKENDIFSTLAVAWFVFFAFAPGVCAQYLVWPAPFVLCFSLRGYLALTAASSLFLFFFYNVISKGMPWNLGISLNLLTPQWVAWTNWPWAAVVACLFYSMKKLRDNAMNSKAPPADY